MSVFRYRVEIEPPYGGDPTWIVYAKGVQQLEALFEIIDDYRDETKVHVESGQWKDEGGTK